MEPKPYSRLSPKRGWSWETPPEPIPAERIAETLEAEVVIVGGGISGLAAGTRCVQKGLKVVILDKCAAAGAHGWQMALMDSPVIRKRGKPIDTTALARDWMEVSGNQPNEDMLWLYLKNSPKVYDWICELAGEELQPQLYTGCYHGPGFKEYEATHHFLKKPDSQYKAKGGGPLLIEILEKRFQEFGGILSRSTKVEQLEQEADGHVTGCIITGSDGVVRRWKATKALVLATGDVGGDDEMLSAFCPIALGPSISVFWPATSNAGDGHKMAYWAGAAFDDAPWAPVMHNHPFGRFNAFYLHVNIRGKRFMNEDTWMQAKSVRCMMQPAPGYAFAVFDGKYLDDFAERFDLMAGQGAMPLNMAVDDVKWDPNCGLKETIDDYVKNGHAFKADTLEELAEKMGVPVDEFLKTVDRYNELYKLGDDPDYGKRPELLTSIVDAPFYAVKWGASLLDVMGGCLTNTKLNILDAYYKPIPGLYAIGNCCGGMYGVDYPLLLNGNSYGRAFSYAQVLADELSGNTDE